MSSEGSAQSSELDSKNNDDVSSSEEEDIEEAIKENLEIL